MKSYQNVYDYFGNCMDSDLGETKQCESKKRYNAMCCEFSVVGEDGQAIDLDISGKFCVSKSQR